MSTYSNLPYVSVKVPVNNGVHRDVTGEVVYYSSQQDIEWALHYLIHGEGTLQMFKGTNAKRLAMLWRTHVLVPLYEYQLPDTAFDLDKVQRIFNSGDDVHFSRGGEFFTSAQITQIVNALINDGHVIRSPATAHPNIANKFFFHTPTAGDTIAIKVTQSAIANAGVDFIISSPQTFLMCLTLHDSDVTSVEWLTVA